MADLIAQGPRRQDRWRRPLPAGQTIVLGRAAGGWSAGWDDRISRQHAEVTATGGAVHVRALPLATNPIFYRGRPLDAFQMRVGDTFVIGETTFTVSDEQPRVSSDLPVPVTEHTFSGEYLRQIEFRSARKRIEMLSRLPELVRHAATERDLMVQVTNLLLSGVTRAEAVAIVQSAGPHDPHPARIVHWDRSRPGSTLFVPSQRLIAEALRRGESVLHIWQPEGGSEFTTRADTDWAFCTPIGGSPGEERAFYVAGSHPQGGERETDPLQLRDDLKFTELVASLVGSLQQVRLLQNRQAAFGQFFSPVVLEALAERDLEQVLAPKETDVSVLFCDLRGFARTSEREAGSLMGLLERVSQALGVVTHQILAEGGVVGDFHGDAAMGFWGWPLPQEDRVARACRAALAIRRELAAASHRPDHPLADFRIGLGVASGRAVAGKIGTEDQVKVTVFGPVVNLAARLEGMTKVVRAPVLVDGATARAVRRQLSPSQVRVRQVAMVRPAGMDQAVEVSELLPPADQEPGLSDDDLACYERGLAALVAGEWEEALEWLHRVPASDQVKDFLTVFIAGRRRIPPDGWDGVIPLDSK